MNYEFNKTSLQTTEAADVGQTYNKGTAELCHNKELITVIFI
jgi:hypothetical protein